MHKCLEEKPSKQVPFKPIRIKVASYEPVGAISNIAHLLKPFPALNSSETICVLPLLFDLIQNCLATFEKYMYRASHGPPPHWGVGGAMQSSPPCTMWVQGFSLVPTSPPKPGGIRKPRTNDVARVLGVPLLLNKQTYPGAARLLETQGGPGTHFSFSRGPRMKEEH